MNEKVRMISWTKNGMQVVIPSYINSRMFRNYDKELYKKRHDGLYTDVFVMCC